MTELAFTVPREEQLRRVLLRAQAVTQGEEDTIANLANTAAVIWQFMEEVSWAGFYLLRGEELVLGPFQGKPACRRIALGKGVCGTAAQTRLSQCVPDVHAFPGHIACDGGSRSELVIPILQGDRVLAVLDLDSYQPDRFGPMETMQLEQLAARLSRCCRWEEELGSCS